MPFTLNWHNCLSWPNIEECPLLARIGPQALRTLDTQSLPTSGHQNVGAAIDGNAVGRKRAGVRAVTMEPRTDECALRRSSHTAEAE